MTSLLHALGFALLGVQTVALVALLLRLAPGRTRRGPVKPVLVPRRDTSVSVIVATLNEAHRIGPCLDGLAAQIDPLLEILVVDSRSTDGTREIVAAYAARDRRIRLITDDPLPPGWVGKVWALETGLQHARGVWVLGIDADTLAGAGPDRRGGARRGAGPARCRVVRSAVRGTDGGRTVGATCDAHHAGVPLRRGRRTAGTAGPRARERTVFHGAA